jgi:hypothetical protein
LANLGCGPAPSQSWPKWAYYHHHNQTAANYHHHILIPILLSTKMLVMFLNTLRNLSTYYKEIFALDKDVLTPQLHGSYVKIYVDTFCAPKESAHIAQVGKPAYYYLHHHHYVIRHVDIAHFFRRNTQE